MNYEPLIRFRNVAEPRSFVTKWEKEISDKATRKKAISRDRDTKRGENFEDATTYEYPQPDNFYNEYCNEETEINFQPTFTSLNSESENQCDEELIKELTYDDIMFYLYFKDKF
jgi:hypothetical protein